MQERDLFPLGYEETRRIWNEFKQRWADRFWWLRYEEDLAESHGDAEDVFV